MEVRSVGATSASFSTAWLARNAVQSIRLCATSIELSRSVMLASDIVSKSLSCGTALSQRARGKTRASNGFRQGMQAHMMATFISIMLLRSKV